MGVEEGTKKIVTCLFVVLGIVFFFSVTFLNATLHHGTVSSDVGSGSYTESTSIFFYK